MFNIIKTNKNTKNLTFLLTGRGQPISHIFHSYENYSNLNSNLIAIEPKHEWYPSPKGPNDQKEAVNGLNENVFHLESFIDELIKSNNTTVENTNLIGFSAGAVMALTLASLRPYKAVVSHNGAILSPESFPQSETEMPILLIHNKDDFCFSWEERYLPMKNALLSKNYNVQFLESETGDHRFFIEDVEAAGDWLNAVSMNSF